MDGKSQTAVLWCGWKDEQSRSDPKRSPTDLEVNSVRLRDKSKAESEFFLLLHLALQTELWKNNIFKLREITPTL